MEIIIPDQKRITPVHPLEVFRQACSCGWRNLRKLGSIYAIFNLPLTLLSLSPQVKALENQKPGLAVWAWLLLLVVISSWGHITLLLAIQKAVAGQSYGIWQSVNRAQTLLIKYLALVFSIVLFVMGVIITGIVAGMLLTFLSKVSLVLVLLLATAVVVAVVSLLVFFLLRWSLASAACVFEKAWPISALNSSLAIVKNYINPLTGVYGLMILVYGAGLIPVIVAQGILGAKAEAAPVQTGLTMYVFLINVILVPLWTTATVVLYNKLKEIAQANVHA